MIYFKAAFNVDRLISLFQEDKQINREKLIQTAFQAADHLNYPFPESKLMNVNKAEAEKQTFDWLEKFFHLSNYPGKKAAILQDDYIGFFARAYPNIESAELLTLVTCFGLWLFLYDDALEKLQNLSEVSAFHQKIASAMRGALNEKEDNPLFTSFSHLFGEIKKYANDVWLNRFIKEVTAYCDATYWEAECRFQQKIPDLETYLQKRLDSSGTLLMFSFLDIDASDTLPESVFFHANFQSFRCCCANLVNYNNDLRSFPKEWRDGEFFNLVMVFKNKLNCSFEEAIQETSKLYNMESAYYSDNKNILPDKFGVLGVLVKKNIDNMEKWIAGYNYWSKRTPRYQLKSKI